MGVGAVIAQRHGTDLGAAGARLYDPACPTRTSSGGKSACGAAFSYMTGQPRADARDYVGILRKKKSGYYELGPDDEFQLDDRLVWTSYGSGAMGSKYGHAAIVGMQNGEPVAVSLFNGRKDIRKISNFGTLHVFRKRQ